MSLINLKRSLISELNVDQHCVYSLKILREEVPYEKMIFMGRIIFKELLKISLNRRKQYLQFKKININRLKHIRIEEPIFITGLPRLGTTLMQDLIIKYSKLKVFYF